MADNNQNSHSNDDLSAKKVLFDCYLDEGARLHQRTDWFLIFHAILLEAYLSEHSKGAIQMVVGSIGIVVSYLWLTTGIRHRWTFMELGMRMTDEKAVGKDISSSLKQIFNARNEKMPAWAFPWARPNSCFGVITPAIFLIAWVILLIIACPKWKWYSLAAAGAVCVVASLVACCLGPGPKFKDECTSAALTDTPGSKDKSTASKS
jgi:hypothetical protein